MFEELMHTEEVDGFTVKWFRCEEDATPGESFNYDDEQMAELYRDIDAGQLEWFAVRVSAYKAGVELADDYLGGCCYESFAAFLAESENGCEGYATDMRANVIRDAKAKIAELCAGS